MNRESKIGKFAVDYNERLLLSPIPTVMKPWSQEFDNNPNLSNAQKNRLKREMESEMVVMNYYLDTAVLSKQIPEYRNCTRDVCFYYSGGKDVMLDESDAHVWTIINDIANCFFLPDLLLLILRNEVNPYTGQRFSNTTKKDILSKYKYEAALLSVDV